MRSMPTWLTRGKATEYQSPTMHERCFLINHHNVRKMFSYQSPQCMEGVFLSVTTMYESFSISVTTVYERSFSLNIHEETVYFFQSTPIKAKHSHVVDREQSHLRNKIGSSFSHCIYLECFHKLGHVTPHNSLRAQTILSVQFTYSEVTQPVTGHRLTLALTLAFSRSRWTDISF